MPITDPTQLVEEFKKSGEFDRLRRDLLLQFQNSDGITAFKTRIESIARQRMAEEPQNLRYRLPDDVQRELLQEIDRFPVVERAVGEIRAFTDPEFIANIRDKARSILQDDAKPKPAEQPETAAAETTAEVAETSTTILSTTDNQPQPQPPQTISTSISPPLSALPNAVTTAISSAALTPEPPLPSTTSVPPPNLTPVPDGGGLDGTQDQKMNEDKSEQGDNPSS